MKVIKKCRKCGKEFLFNEFTSTIKKGAGKYCSMKCKGMGFDIWSKNNPRWRGGIKIHACGYRLISVPTHPFKDKQGYVREHRLVMEKHLSRYLEKNELVHHINGNKVDNRLENLQLTNRSEHKKLHPEIGMKTRFRKGIRNFEQSNYAATR